MSTRENIRLIARASLYGQSVGIPLVLIFLLPRYLDDLLNIDNPYFEQAVTILHGMKWI